MIKMCISVTSHALDPPPPLTNCHTFSDPLPRSSVTYFMDGPYVCQPLNSSVPFHAKFPHKLN